MDIYNKLLTASEFSVLQSTEDVNLETDAWRFDFSLSDGELVALQGLSYAFAWIGNELGFRTSRDVLEGWISQIANNAQKGSFSETARVRLQNFLDGAAHLNIEQLNRSENSREFRSFLETAIKLTRVYSGCFSCIPSSSNKNIQRVHGELKTLLRDLVQEDVDAYITSYRRLDQAGLLGQNPPLEKMDAYANEIRTVLRLQGKVSEWQKDLSLRNEAIYHLPQGSEKHLRLDSLPYVPVSQEDSAKIDAYMLRAVRQIQDQVRTSPDLQAMSAELKREVADQEGRTWPYRFYRDQNGNYPIELNGEHLGSGVVNVDQRIRASLRAQNEKWVKPIEAFCSQLLHTQVRYDGVIQMGVIDFGLSKGDYPTLSEKKTAGRRTLIETERDASGNIRSVKIRSIVSSAFTVKKGHLLQGTTGQSLAVEQSVILSCDEKGEFQLSDYKASVNTDFQPANQEQAEIARYRAAEATWNRLGALNKEEIQTVLDLQQRAQTWKIVKTLLEEEIAKLRYLLGEEIYRSPVPYHPSNLEEERTLQRYRQACGSAIQEVAQNAEQLQASMNTQLQLNMKHQEDSVVHQFKRDMKADFPVRLNGQPLIPLAISGLTEEQQAVHIKQAAEKIRLELGPENQEWNDALQAICSQLIHANANGRVAGIGRTLGGSGDFSLQGQYRLTAQEGAQGRQLSLEILKGADGKVLEVRIVADSSFDLLAQTNHIAHPIGGAVNVSTTLRLTRDEGGVFKLSNCHLALNHG